MAELTIEHIESVKDRDAFLVSLVKVEGSTPRNAGAMMIVGSDFILGTIGGGSAEWVAIQTIRGFLDGNAFFESEAITLGPQIDQCCGGVLDVEYTKFDQRTATFATEAINEAMPDHVLIFGAGHTGLALANALAPLGLEIEIVDNRAQYDESTIGHKLSKLAVPEDAVRNARAGSIFIITTHDHSLDFLITAEALAKGNAKYVGMIGSPTKRAVLKSWLKENEYNADSIANLHCPLGGNKVKNKQPEIIAALTVAEILEAIEVQD